MVLQRELFRMTYLDYEFIPAISHDTVSIRKANDSAITYGDEKNIHPCQTNPVLPTCHDFFLPTFRWIVCFDARSKDTVCEVARRVDLLLSIRF